ncbi:sulfotransferase family protein [Nocardioides anomalus]|uniref:sulfotransferase family protein n=1 Tax=Nocardioides anomalus TaxID=2712223 RepID=UPI001E54011C|nr:sulfotransferase [Nocardioides anomalus]
MARPLRPDFIIVGAPKAGTTALHSALALHPDVFTTTPKEPKYWLCGDAPPPHWVGPGDAHSQQEWVWRRRDYEALFRPAADRQVRGESTPFYLWSYPAHRRIAEHLPEVKLIAVIRDPIDRAYSNWMHLWSDGLEKEPDFERAFHLQAERIDRGWAPFWRYKDLGLYGRQLEHLYQYVDPARVHVVRYRDIVESPVETTDEVCRFLGIRTGLVHEVPRDNARAYASPAGAPPSSARPSAPAPGPASSCAPRSGVRPPYRSSTSSRPAAPTGPSSPRTPAPGCCRTSPTTSTCSRS